MGLRILTRREKRRRYHSDAVRAARKRRVYEREATVEELDGDLAVLRAVRDAAQSRRTWIAVLIAVCLGAGAMMSLNMQNAGPIVVGIGVAIVLGFFRKMTRVWDVRRINLASGVLRQLAVAPNEPVKLMLNLRPTQKRKNFVSAAGITRRYRLEWLSIEAKAENGTAVRLRRDDEIHYSESHSGRTTRMQWNFYFTDHVDLRPASAARRLPQREELQLPEQFQVTEFEAAPERLALSVHSGVRWWAWPVAPAQPEVLDGARTMVGWVGILSVLGGLEAPTREAIEPAQTWLPPIGPRAIAMLLLLISVAPLALVANAVDRMTSYIYEHTPIRDRPQFEEGLVGAIACLVLWVIALLLLVLPRRLARRIKD